MSGMTVQGVITIASYENNMNRGDKLIRSPRQKKYRERPEHRRKKYREPESSCLNRGENTSRGRKIAWKMSRRIGRSRIYRGGI
eukprot:UN12905